MKKLFYSLTIAALTFGAAASRATTVIPPTFGQLVSGADVIFQGKVTDVRSYWATLGGERHIWTDVTFAVSDVVKGQPGATYTLHEMGGTVDGQTFVIADAPRFHVGDNDLLFVEHNGAEIVPLVGFMHGRYHVEREATGREVVKTDGGAPLANPSQVGGHPQTAASAMSVDDFKGAIRHELTRATQLDHAAQ